MNAFPVAALPRTAWQGAGLGTLLSLRGQQFGCLFCSSGSPALPGSRDWRAGPKALPAVEGKEVEHKAAFPYGRVRGAVGAGGMGAEVGSDDEKPSG